MVEASRTLNQEDLVANLADTTKRWLRPIITKIVDKDVNKISLCTHNNEMYNVLVRVHICLIIAKTVKYFAVIYCRNYFYVRMLYIIAVVNVSIKVVGRISTGRGKMLIYRVSINL